MILQLLLQIVLPSGLILMLWYGRYASRLRWSLEVGVFALAVLFLLLTARWDMTSIHLRWIVLMLFLTAAAVSFHRLGAVAGGNTKPSHRGSNGLNLIMILVLAGLNSVVISGYRTPAGAVDLEFPLRNGTYYVGGGGTSRWINNHVAYPPQNFAVDVVQLNRFGNRGTIFGSANLEDYEIYGSFLYSPCDGEVVIAVDGLPDLIPPERDLENLAGNHVVVACEGIEVVLAHLMNGSVKVVVGDSVATGELIGRVGNSGNTSQPHLHVHAERGGESRLILNGQGIPITFDGRFALRNSVFRISEN